MSKLSVDKILTNSKNQNIPSFNVGDVIKVHQEIKEGEKKRVQAFEGLVIARKHGKELGATFTVRRKISGIGTEKIYPLHSPTIKKVEIIKKPRRISSSKLYWTRIKTDKEIQKRLHLEQQVVNKKNTKKIVTEREEVKIEKKNTPKEK
ncbi:MAG: 50S ribosomal protein L19 [Candidatus Heimdallarchaeaceae archaeon]